MEHKFFSVCAVVMFFVFVAEAGKYFTTQNGNKYFVQETIVKNNWYEALEACEEENMTLATPNTLEKKNDIVHSLYRYGLHTLWTSGIEGYQGLFIWYANGENLTYTNWKTGEPVQHDHTMRHCIQIERYEDSVWVSKPCTDKKIEVIICEEESSLEVKTKDLELNLLKTFYETELDQGRSIN